METRKLFSLSIGDRFYFFGDRKRKVWQIEHKESTTRINSFNKEVERTIIHYRDDLNHFEKETNNLPVVFIRSVNG